MTKLTRIAVAALAAHSVRTTLLLAVFALVVGAGAAAAAPGNGNAPDDAGPDAAGPPTDLPGPVPDFVEEIHRTVGEFLSGSVDSLGSVVSDLTPGGESTVDGSLSSLRPVRR